MIHSTVKYSAAFIIGMLIATGVIFGISAFDAKNNMIQQSVEAYNQRFDKLEDHTPYEERLAAAKNVDMNITLLNGEVLEYHSLILPVLVQLEFGDHGGMPATAVVSRNATAQYAIVTDTIYDGTMRTQFVTDSESDFAVRLGAFYENPEFRGGNLTITSDGRFIQGVEMGAINSTDISVQLVINGRDS